MSEQTTNPPVLRAVTSTSFDFLNGSYKKAASARMAVIIAIGSLLLVATLILVYGLNMMLKASDAQAEASAAFGQAQNSSRELASLSQSGGYTEEEMTAHIEKKTEEILAAAQGSLPVAALTNDLNANMPSGMSLDSLTVTPGGEGAEATLSIGLRATDLSGVQQSINLLQNLTYIQFNADDITWTQPGEDGMTISIPATLDSASLNSQYNRLSQQLSLGQTQNGERP